MLIVITGNAGVGKSTIFKKLVEESIKDHNDFSLFDHDKEISILYEDDQIQLQLKQEFGVFTKKEIAALLWNAAPQKRLKLQRQLFEVFVVRMLGKLNHRYKHNQWCNNKILLCDFPMYFEALDMASMMQLEFPKPDLVFVFTLDEGLRRDRLLHRGLTDSQISAITSMQYSQEYICGCGDFCLDAVTETKDVSGLYRTLKYFAATVNEIKGLCHSLLLECPDVHNKFSALNIGAMLVPFISTVRYYHSLDHIKYMLKQLLDCVQQNDLFIHDMFVLILAILGHDVIYDTTRKDNEEKSASFISGKLKQLDVSSGRNPFAILVGMILATKDHVVPKSFPFSDPTVAENCALFLDLDLAVFKEEKSVLLANVEGIRKEYSQYTDAEYRTGRIAFLKGLLDRPLFHSQYFVQYEDTAKENIAWLISQLELEQAGEDIQLAK